MFGIDDAALALLVAGGLSTAGALYTNAKNRKLQGNINDASINLANTAHQREVLDLLQAGINPILTAGGSGASVPQLNAAQVENPTQGLADSMGQSAKYLSEQYKLDNNLRKADYLSAHANAMMDQMDEEYQERTFSDNLQSAIFNANASREDAEASYLDALARKNAMESIYSDDEALGDYLDNLKDGYIASAKMAANANWQENTRIGIGVANAAANVWSAVRSGRGMPVNVEETIENFDRRGRFNGRTIRTRRGR